MPSIVERIKRLISPEAAEKGAEDDVIERAPESVKSRLKNLVQRRRQAAEAEKVTGVARGRADAMADAERG